jgi:hypothetical protein
MDRTAIARIYRRQGRALARPLAAVTFRPVAVSFFALSLSSVLGDHGDVGVPGVSIFPDTSIIQRTDCQVAL